MKLNICSSDRVLTLSEGTSWPVTDSHICSGCQAANDVQSNTIAASLNQQQKHRINAMTMVKRMTPLIGIR